MTILVLIYGIIGVLIWLALLVLVSISFFKDKVWQDPAWSTEEFNKLLIILFILAIFCSIWPITLFIGFIEEYEEKFIEEHNK